eukprot:g31588.t1
MLDKIVDHDGDGRVKLEDLKLILENGDMEQLMNGRTSEATQIATTASASEHRAKHTSAASAVLNEELKTGRFVKKIGLHPEEREYFDIELENTAICLVQDGILMMSSIFVHEANALKVEVLEDFDAPALPAGMVPMGPLLSLWPEHVTFLEEVHVVLPVCSGAKNAWCTTDGGWKQIKRLTKIVRCRKATDARWYDAFRCRAFSTISCCADRGASKILLVGVQAKMQNSTREELRFLDKDLQHASEKNDIAFYHLLQGLECPIDGLEENLRQWLRSDGKHQVVIASCCEDDEEEARHICKSLNEGLDVFEYADVLSHEEIIWNLSINAVDRVMAQLEQDGSGIPVEKFGEAMRMLGLSTKMKVSTKSIDILSLHDMLLQELFEQSATRTPLDMLLNFLRILDEPNGRGTMRVSALKRFLGLSGRGRSGATRPPTPTGLCTELREAEIPLSQLGQLLLDPTTQQRLLNDNDQARRHPGPRPPRRPAATSDLPRDLPISTSACRCFRPRLPLVPGRMRPVKGVLTNLACGLVVRAIYPQRAPLLRQSLLFLSTERPVYRLAPLGEAERQRGGDPDPWRA